MGVVAIGAARPGAVGGHRCSWSQEGGFGCHALLLQVRGDWAWYKALFGFKGWASKEICWRCMANCSDIPWTDTSTAAAWRTSRYRTSELLARQTEQGISVNPLFSLPGFSVEGCVASICCTRWVWARRRTRLDIYVSIWSQAGLGHNLFSFSCMCVCACMFVCVRLCSECTSSCVFVSPASPGFFCAQSRSGRIAELWNRIKLHYKTLHTQSRLQKLTWEMIRVDQKPPKLRAKGAETRHLVRCCYELAMDFHKQQRSAHSLTLRGLFGQLFGLYLTMSVEVLSPVLHPLQSCVQGSLRRQVVEAEAEGAHGPRDVRGAV